MNNLDKAIGGMNVMDELTRVLDLSPEAAEQRRKDNAERREEERSDRQQAHEDAGMRESDFY